jgi:hypothetical protein
MGSFDAVLDTASRPDAVTRSLVGVPQHEMGVDLGLPSMGDHNAGYERSERLVSGTF